MINERYDIILFDGVCNLCNGFVRFIIKYDKRRSFKLYSLQSDQGRILLEKNRLEHFSNNTIVYINENKVFIRSEAVLNILKRIGYPWKVMYVFIILPQFVRDWVYNFIAKHRYTLFGKSVLCDLTNNKDY